MAGQTISSKATLSLLDMFPNATREQLEALSNGTPVPPSSDSVAVPQSTAVQPTVVNPVISVPISSGYGVSCIMPVADLRRRNMARAGINRFLTQKYPDKELIVVNGMGTSLLDTTHPLIVEVMVPDPELSIGAMRNIGIKHATKPWIAQWDDDDYRDSHLLAYQMGFAEQDKAILLSTVVLLQLKTDKNVTSFAPSAAFKTLHGHPATLIFPNNGCVYPDGSLEDENFYRTYWADKAVIVNNTTYPYNMYMVAVHHGLNKTSAPVFMHGKNDTGNMNLPGEMCVRRLQDILVSFGYRLSPAPEAITLTASPTLLHN